MEDLRETQPALDRAKKNDLTLVAAEITESSTNLVSFTQEMSTLTNVSYGVVFGNEVQ
ncbi:RNA methyltransferase [bacterium]|nr:RNA methyltransferase [bacterium]